MYKRSLKIYNFSIKNIFEFAEKKGKKDRARSHTHTHSKVKALNFIIITKHRNFNITVLPRPILKSVELITFIREIADVLHNYELFL